MNRKEKIMKKLIAMIAFVATLTVSAFADTNSTERWTVSLGGAGATTTVDGVFS